MVTMTRAARLLLAWGGAGLLAACAEQATTRPDESSTPRPSASLSSSAALPTTITPALAGVLSAASPTDLVFVVVAYDEAITSGAVLAQRIMGLGAGARALQQLPFVGALGTPAQIESLAVLPGVTAVSDNHRLKYLGHASGMLAFFRFLDESVPTIKADQARARYGVSGRGIGVAILDSGIDGLYQQDVGYPTRTVQNLKVVANQADIVCFQDAPCASSIYVENLPNSETSVGHGTHVSGIAGGNGANSGGLYTGVAPGSNLIGIGTGDILFIFWALAGFDYILQNQDRYNIKVVNNSWGTSGPFDPNDPINVATKRVTDRGITVVFAAGNDGPDQNTLNPYSVAPWVIGVAAACSATDTLAQRLHCQPGGHLADFSSRGIPGDPLYHPTVTAPGVHVNSTRASTGTVLNADDAPHDFDLTSSCGLRIEFAAYYTCASGTSMASPHVTGVVALMQERAGGSLTPAEVRKLLIQTADPMQGYATFEVGAGMVNALAAVGRSR
jgi:serine protease AprX